MTNSMGGGGINYVEQFYSTNIKLQAFEDALAETMVLIQIFVTLSPPDGLKSHSPFPSPTA